MWPVKNWNHLLIGCNPCTKFGIDQVKGSKDIELTTQWAEKSGLTLTFELVTWKSIGSSTHWGQHLNQVWYGSSERVKRYWAVNTGSTDRPTDCCKRLCPLSHCIIYYIIIQFGQQIIEIRYYTHVLYYIYSRDITGFNHWIKGFNHWIKVIIFKSSYSQSVRLIKSVVIKHFDVTNIVFNSCSVENLN